MEQNHLPEFLRPFFWDVDFDALSLDARQDFIVRRLLGSGSWQALTWLREQLGDADLRLWIEGHAGAGLTPRQLRFWEAVLDLPHAKVTRWIRLAAQNPWERRINR